MSLSSPPSQKSKGSADGGKKTRIAVSAICAILAAAHLIWPRVKIDIATLVLLVVAILPWLASIIRSIELPGGFKIELRDVKAATEKVTSGKAAARVRPPTTGAGGDIEFLHAVADSDPNLALVGLRIEIERRLSRLAELAQLPSARRSASAILRDLVARGQINQQTAVGLGDLIALGNQAAHGVEVSPAAAEWALDASPLILEVLDSLVEQRSDTREVG